jgi:hypothetical protein
MYHTIKDNRDDLSAKLEEAKSKVDDTWKDVKYWFLEKFKSFRSYFEKN